ncbi:MAG: CoA-binding protein [Actinobacteria bacterium]|nr:CoA-binding protein [Actinomycetota bacterium]
MDQELKKSLDRIFHPSSVAIAGVSERRDSPGTLFLRSLLDMGFPGDLHPVNPRYAEIMGMRCYPDITSLPRVPDLAILSVPPEAVPPLVRECAAAGVGGCVINTAGFSESGRPEGRRLEEEIRQAKEGSALRLVGPNCMGIYSSRGRVALFAGMFPVTGRAGMISQSGSISSISFLTGMERGILFDKIVSSGNELDLNCSDFLAYLAEDASVEIIMAYLEEVREARRFLAVAASLRGRKPLLVFKGGLTPAGNRAAASHTAALGGNAEILEGAARQAGIILVEDLGQMLDIAAALYHLPPPRGRRVAIVSSPGGLGVNSADAVERAGLQTAVLSAQTVAELSSFLPGEGTSFSNPVDLGFGAVVPGNYRRVLEILDRDPGVDIILAVGSAPASRDGDIGLLKSITDEVLEARQRMDTPVVVVLFPSAFAAPHAARLHAAAVPAYLTPTAACLSLRRYVDFHRAAGRT